MININAFSWTALAIARLTELWAQDIKTNAIAATLTEEFNHHCGKNAVVGKAHRLGLIPRPSPIRRGVKVKRIRKPKIAAKAIPVVAQPHPCRWPLEDGHGHFASCGAAAEPRRPYCGAHSKLAYMKPSMSREAVAERNQRLANLKAWPR